MANKENIQKWVDALRSGEYEQGVGDLNRNGQFCCLDVACEVAIANGLNVERAVAPQGSVAYNDNRQFLPDEVVGWLGISSYNPVLDEDEMSTATYYNDVVGSSFSAIADLIEAKYLNEQG